MVNFVKKCVYLLIAVLLLHLNPLPASADIFQKYAKVIWIDQENQVGAAYGRGRKLLEFPIMTGDDETRTPPGTYLVKRKEPNYFSRKYKVPMPYSLFFDLKGMRAIHEGDVPDPEEKSEWATHGCVHVEQPYMKWLYDWAEKGKTVVVVRGRRVWDDEEGKRLEEREEGEEKGKLEVRGEGEEKGKFEEREDDEERGKIEEREEDED